MPGSSQWRREATNAFQLLQHELNRLLDSYLQPTGFRGPESPPTDLEPTAWSAPVDVYATPEELMIVVEVPGVVPASIDLTVTGNVLTLRGVKETTGLPEAFLQVRERLFGTFHRQISLPSEVDFEKADADIEHGVLKIRLPKRFEAQPRTIPIRPG
ncbi:MAG: Hsp20/alpha crystallin family protein [Isosphaeraceae bacterium]